MASLETTKREEQVVASAPMENNEGDESNEKPENGKLEDASIEADKSELSDSNQVKEHSEQQSRNSEIMRQLEDKDK